MGTTNAQNSDDNTTKSVLQTSIQNKKKQLFSTKAQNFTKKKTFIIIEDVGTCLMKVQQTYNATLWMTKSFPSTFEGRRSLRKPTQTTRKSHRTINVTVGMNDIHWK